jgi:hypothetical protein
VAVAYEAGLIRVSSGNDVTAHVGAISTFAALSH